eukprot:6193533-Pleurochrysis_carterae.AAC.2
MGRRCCHVPTPCRRAPRAACDAPRLSDAAQPPRDMECLLNLAHPPITSVDLCVTSASAHNAAARRDFAAAALRDVRA